MLHEDTFIFTFFVNFIKLKGFNKFIDFKGKTYQNRERKFYEHMSMNSQFYVEFHCQKFDHVFCEQSLFEKKISSRHLSQKLGNANILNETHYVCTIGLKERWDGNGLAFFVVISCVVLVC